MKTKIFIILFIFFTLLNYSQTSADIDRIVHEEMIRQDLPGLAIGVYKRGTISFIKGYGYIDVNKTKPITTSTPFRWASISKTITAVAALQVAERKSNFSINDKVTKHYPYWTSNWGSRAVNDKSRKENITIKHLLTNRSGINHYGHNQGVNYRKSTYKTDSDQFNANSCVNVFRDMPLLFNPGSKYDYSTYGFNLLGAVIDKATGSYTNWVKNNIANKLGMSSLKVSSGNFYGFQKKTDGIIKSANIANKEYVLPGGGWESNVSDLLKFARGILDKRLLTNTASLWASDYSQEYKRGISSINTTNDFRIWHGGAHGNVRTLMYIMPNKHIAVVVMIPAEYASTWNIVRKVVNKMGVNRSSSIVNSPLDKCGDGMGSSSKKFIGVWRKNQNDVIIRRGYSSSNFNKEWNYLKSKGYYAADIEYTSQGWEGIFKKGTGQYAMWRNYDQTGFNTKWKEMNSKGYRLYDLETYVISGQRKWAGLFKKSSGKYALFRNLSTSAFGTKRNELAKQGLKLIDIEVYNSSSGQKWSGVWVAGTDGLLNRNYSYNDFKALVSDRIKKGYKLIDVETYMVGSTRKWAGIWEKSSQMQFMSTPLNYCSTMGSHNTSSSNGYELIDFQMH